MFSTVDEEHALLFFFEEIRKFWLDFTMVIYEKIYFEVYISNTIDSKIILHNFTTCNAMDWLSGLSGATISFYMLTSPLISLHIRSMWETICDAWACWSGWNFGPNSTEDPYSELGTEYPPPPRKLSESPNPRVSEYPPKWKLSESSNLRVSEYPLPNENCQRVQVWEFQNTPPKWKLSESSNPRVSEYPTKMKIVREFKSKSFRISPPKWKLSESSNPRVSEYPPKMKIGRESRCKSFRVPSPPNENCQRVQILEFQNTPPDENCQRVQIWEFQNTPPPKWKLSESPNPWVSEYPPPKIGKTSE